MAIQIMKEQNPEILAALPLEALNQEIDRCLWGYENGGTSQGRKSYFKRLVMLEQVRERAHDIPAKPRAFRTR